MTPAKKQPPQATARRPGRPRQAEDAPNHNTAHHILMHAKRLFMEKSFSAVSISDIVVAAEISKPTLYYYFPDKEHLYAAVLGEMIEQAGVYFREVLDKKMSLREKLVMVAEGFFDHAPTSLPCLLRDVTQHLNNHSSEQVLDQYETSIHRPFEILFGEAIAAGELKQANPKLLAELFLTMLDWLSLRFVCQQDPPLTNQEKALQVVQLFLDGAAV